MPVIALAPETHATVAARLTDSAWCVACLCAAWCDVCGHFRSSFEFLAEQHPQMTFVWIDIEDEADLVGDVDVENFPTLLIQQADQVTFFGTVEPDVDAIHRLIQAYARQPHTTSASGRQDSSHRPNLRARLRKASGRLDA